MENKLKTKDKRQKKQDKRKSPLGRSERSGDSATAEACPAQAGGLGWVYNAEDISE
jgi:hypothetical protein